MNYFLLLIVVTYQQKCQWVDEDNRKYDYTNLDHPSAWHVVDTQNGMGMFNMVYIFNFCNINLSCHGIPVAVYEGLEVMGTITDNCDIVGLKSTTSISHIQDKPKDYGISISFNDNSQCVETANQNRAVQTDKPRTAIFNIVCSEKAEKQFRIAQGYGCTVTLEIYHPAGCPLNRSMFFGLTKVFLVTFHLHLSTLLQLQYYFILQVLYIIKKQGKSQVNKQYQISNNLKKQKNQLQMLFKILKGQLEGAIRMDTKLCECENNLFKYQISILIFLKLKMIFFRILNP